MPFVDPARDAARIARRLNDVLAGKAGAGCTPSRWCAAGFFRNRGAYLVGRLVLEGNEYKPFVIALVNERGGRARRGGAAHDAAGAQPVQLHRGAVPGHQPPTTTSSATFLHSIMPTRPLGLHYSTIGFHHVSKVAVMNEVRRHLGRERELLDDAPGSPGTVAMAFTSPRSAYILKVIRDRPTGGYKWDSFEGVDAVLDKYKRVHEINRTGSMLDNILYYNLKLDAAWFEPGLLQELLSERRATPCSCRTTRWCSSTWWCSAS